MSENRASGNACGCRVNGKWIAVIAIIGVCVGRLRFDIENLGYSIMLQNSPPHFDSPSNHSTLAPWQPGLLDIHHLLVGSSVSTFVVMPDGTTMLIDAGEVDVKQQEKWWTSLGEPYNKLRSLYPFPNESKTPAGWILDYIKEFWPHHPATPPKAMALDYLLVTHFHSDHIGEATKRMPISQRGNYSLSGITALVEQMTVRKVIDRGYPTYNFPLDLASFGGSDVRNYLKFVQANNHSISFEQFVVGSTRQIELQIDPEGHNFHVQVIKNGMQVIDPEDPTTTRAINGTVLDENDEWNENTMSAAIVLKYDDFVYYEGGDQEIIHNQRGDIILDTIGPTARAAGKVDVASLNHHGHGVTDEFVKVLDPPVTVLQGWCSDQPRKESMELLSSFVTAQGKPRQIFATKVFPEHLQALGASLSKPFVSTSGHVVIRVQPRANNRVQMFDVFVLNGERKIKSHHGQYSVRDKQTYS